MLDTGLLLTLGLLYVVVAIAARRAPVSTMGHREILDRLLGPLLAGLVTARLVAVVLDDPTSLRSLRALLVIRGGVEFWPGVAVAMVTLGWGLHRHGRQVPRGLAELAPFALWGYATYEATCLVREGCYGPASLVGLTPDGLRTRMFPVGLAVGLIVALLGMWARRSVWSPTARVLLAVGGVAAARSVASFWLPRIGGGLTRPHVESVVVLLGVLAVAVARQPRGRRAQAATARSTASSPEPPHS